MIWLQRLFGRMGGGAALSCSQVAEVLQQYLDGELAPSEVPKVLAHLEQCRECGLEADLYRRIQQSLHLHRDTPRDESMTKIRKLANDLANSRPSTIPATDRA